MSAIQRIVLSLSSLFVFLTVHALAQNLETKNSVTVVEFGPVGLVSIKDVESGIQVDLARDAWSLALDNRTLRSEDGRPEIKKTATGDIAYDYELSGYRIRVTYRLRAGWRFVGKQIEVVGSPKATFTVHQVVPWEITVRNTVTSDYEPSTYLPQFGKNIAQSGKFVPGKDFGEFLRLARNSGAMLVVQNPFLEVHRDGQTVTVGYSPEMDWQQPWGDFESDTACIGAYRLSGRRVPREMVLEWHLPPTQMSDYGMDEAEISAFTGCVRTFLIDPSSTPISVEVGWTLNDYQIDVGTGEGKAEYKRIIDTASELGIQTLLYAPANSTLADRVQSTDSWSWEFVLWLNMGEKIRKGEWDPTRDPVPPSVSDMISYAKQKHVGLLAYVYPSVPFSVNPSWLVKRSAKNGDPFTYATLASRELQDYLIRNLIAFQKRTGIAGYSFDYTWLDLPGSSSYAQWNGWRRVMEALKRSVPSIVIDGRAAYQMYGPWIWLAGNHPCPVGDDEQPESFKPFPDLHFDRVSADRARFVNYWYRNYQFAPEEIIPGFATHQTERSRNLPDEGGSGQHVEMMYTRYRPRDWDYMGFRYSFISSIATGGWNNVVNMIPARDPEEAKSFSAEDKAWIRNWLAWTVQNKEYLRHTRTILDQPAIGHADGTAAIVGDGGYIFLFNPNYKQLQSEFSLNETIGLTRGEKFLLKEVYPESGRLLGKPSAGVWSRGDVVHLPLDGTSATVLKLIPKGKLDQPILFNAAALHQGAPPSIVLKRGTLLVEHAAGEPGTIQKLGVLLPTDSNVSMMTVNGNAVKFTQSGSYAEAQVQFEGNLFAQAQEIKIAPSADGLLTGTFVVPQRVLDQLAARRLKWPIPWTREDYESTWLVPERLLLFVQAAKGTDSMTVSAKLDGQPLKFQPAYSSSRVNASTFVGFYADLSKIAPDVRHTIELRVPQMAPGQWQGIFFDNVTSQLTESLAAELSLSGDR
jgi:hypothetical protein